MIFKDVFDLFERLKRKIIVRKGKKKIVKRATRPGYTNRGGKEVRMSPEERRKRRKSQRLAAIKRRAKGQATKQLRRQRSQRLEECRHQAD